MSQDYYKTRESVEEYIHMAKDVNGALLINELRKYLPESSDLLEIGSGPGTDFNILQKTYQVTGSDNSKEFLKHLKKENPNERFLQLDAITLNTDKKFNGIYSNKVLHHLKDNQLETSVKRQHEILKPQGIICHSFWKGEGSEYFKGMFVNYHTENELKIFLKDFFEILQIIPYREFENDDSLLLIAKKV